MLLIYYALYCNDAVRIFSTNRMHSFITSYWQKLNTILSLVGGVIFNLM